MIRLKQLLTVTLLCIGTFVSANAMAAMADGKPSFKAGQNPGLYVWRDAKGHWQVQLASGGKYQNAAGGFSSTRPFNWMSQVALEGNDSAQKRNPNVVDFDLKTSTSDYLDGVAFAVPDGAGVCFWSWGTVGKTVYVGAGATPVTTPVDLTGNGACSGGDGGSGGGSSNTGGNTGGSTPPPPTSGGYSGGLKYNPGHYIAMNDWEGQSAMIEAVTKPGVKGVLVRYLWRDLEPSHGQYNFSKIQSDLQLMADHGKQLVVRVEDKSFEPHIKPTPSYMWANHTLWHANWRGGYVAKRWDSWVTDRMGALTKAMGARFDNHPNFEGITFEESTLSFTNAQMKQYGYSPERYRDETIRMLKNTRAHFPKSQVFWSMNFFEGKQEYIGQIANAVAPLKIAMGGPDVMPDDWPLKTHTYPYYRQFKDRMTLFASMQYVAYNHPRADKKTKYWTPSQLFWFAKDQLHAKYMFWTQKRTAEPRDSYTWLDALPVIRQYQTF